MTHQCFKRIDDIIIVTVTKTQNKMKLYYWTWPTGKAVTGKWKLYFTMFNLDVISYLMLGSCSDAFLKQKTFHAGWYKCKKVEQQTLILVTMLTFNT